MFNQVTCNCWRATATQSSTQGAEQPQDPEHSQGRRPLPQLPWSAAGEMPATPSSQRACHPCRRELSRPSRRRAIPLHHNVTYSACEPQGAYTSGWARGLCRGELCCHPSHWHFCSSAGHVSCLFFGALDDKKQHRGQRAIQTCHRDMGSKPRNTQRMLINQKVFLFVCSFDFEHKS